MEIARQCFASLEKTHNGAFGSIKYYILIDGTYRKDFYADDDNAAIEVFKEWCNGKQN